MPIQLDIFNKKILSSQSRFGTYNILLSGDTANVDLSNYYTKDNPSGYITGVDLSSYYAKDNPSGYITAQNVVFTTGNQTISGNKIFANDITVQGAVLVNQVIDITTTGSISGITGEFKYIKTEGGLVSGGDFEVYADSYTFSGADVNFYGDEYVFSGADVFFAANTGYFSNRPLVNGTGVLLSGEAYPNNNPSGFITNQNVVYATGDQTISGLKDFQTIPTVNNIPVLLSGDPVDLIHLYGKNDEASTIYKGQPVYIGGANGANPLIKIASNTGERTSSKTIGLLAQDLAVNQFGYVITEGTLEGFDTSAGMAGDPIWLGPTGSLIFGTGNKPHAPNHLVYLGVVLRSNQNNGKVYIRTQNGYEINELHDVAALNPQDRDALLYNSISGLWVSRQLTSSDLPSTVVYTTGDQVINGKKTFNTGINIYFDDNVPVGVFVSGAWRNTGVRYTGIYSNIILGSGITPNTTNNLLNLRVNNTGVFNINSKGQVLIQQLAGTTVYDNIFEVTRGGTSYLAVRDDGPTLANSLVIHAGGPHRRSETADVSYFNSNHILSWSNDPTAATPAITNDLILRRDAAGILAQRNGLNAQQFRVYNYTGTNTGEFGVFGWQSTGITGTPNALIIGAQATQSGVLRDVILTGSTINIASSGVIIPNPTVPTTTGSQGIRGQISWDNDFIYVCVSGNSWKRSALTTW